jgi:Ca2+-binding RTX toxin-like protein
MNPERTQLRAALDGPVFAIATLLSCTLASGGVASATTPTCHGRPATVIGTPGSDVFERPDVDHGDVFVLLGGNDSVDDDAKNVTVCGGSGRDDITAFGRAHGRKTLFDGGPDGDYLISGLPGRRPGLFRGPRAPLHLLGGKGRDELSAGQGDDTIRGGSGGDFAWGLKGDDVIRGGRGEDRILGNGDEDRLYGNRGRDILFGDWARESQPDVDTADGGRNIDKCRAEVRRRCER